MKVERKVERFQTRGLFWRLVVLNMAISKKIPSLVTTLTLLFSMNKVFCVCSTGFLFVFSMPKLPKEKH
jgi:formate hydrogenlyase subunit 4